MFDGNALLEQLDCRRGAPMGRISVKEDLTAPVTLFRVQLDIGGYDAGGAYWGTGRPLYAIIGEGFRAFVRADSLLEAEQKIKDDYPDLKITFPELNDDFLEGYIQSALGFSHDEENGGYLADKYDRSDIEEETLQKMKDDCTRFLAECTEFIKPEFFVGGSKNIFEQAGHDFWLTRCGHGCGFNDGDWKEPADEVLTQKSHDFGDANLSVENGKIYLL